MNAPIIAFFNNKGGVGKTSLVYHLAWMYADQGYNVLAADLDPQANLTAAFLDEERLEELWSDEAHPQTVYGCIEPLLRGVGDIVEHPHTEPIDDQLHLVVGDLSLGGFEDELSQQWPRCVDGQERAFRVISAFWRLLQRAAEAREADSILIDLGPNLGAINRAALVAADHLVVPLAPDLFSLQGLKNLGPTVRTWRKEWKVRRECNSTKSLKIPAGRVEPAGYVVMQHAVRLDRPVKAYERWVARIPEVYALEVMGEKRAPGRAVGEDPDCLGLVKHYRSLMPMAQEARKPMFELAPADGAIGAHAKAVQDARENFRQLAARIAERCKLKKPAAQGT
ncbi:MAG: ParA family protein [Planctomycetes bacterium]|nr:ParA family protein [Planctomycetota bacterium]